MEISTSMDSPRGIRQKLGNLQHLYRKDGSVAYNEWFLDSIGKYSRKLIWYSIYLYELSTIGTGCFVNIGSKYCLVCFAGSTDGNLDYELIRKLHLLGLHYRYLEVN